MHTSGEWLPTTVEWLPIEVLVQYFHGLWFCSILTGKMKGNLRYYWRADWNRAAYLLGRSFIPQFGKGDIPFSVYFLWHSVAFHLTQVFNVTILRFNVFVCKAYNQRLWHKSRIQTCFQLLRVAWYLLICIAFLVITHKWFFEIVHSFLARTQLPQLTIP